MAGRLATRPAAASSLDRQVSAFEKQGAPWRAAGRCRLAGSRRRARPLRPAARFLSSRRHRVLPDDPHPEWPSTGRGVDATPRGRRASRWNPPLLSTGPRPCGADSGQGHGSRRGCARPLLLRAPGAPPGTGPNKKAAGRRRDGGPHSPWRTVPLHFGSAPPSARVGRPPGLGTGASRRSPAPLLPDSQAGSALGMGPWSASEALGASAWPRRPSVTAMAIASPRARWRPCAAALAWLVARREARRRRAALAAAPAPPAAGPPAGSWSARSIRHHNMLRSRRAGDRTECAPGSGFNFLRSSRTKHEPALLPVPPW
jgi:hypothetical protein